MALNSYRKVLGRAQRRASRTHRRLLDAALGMFIEKGIDATSIHDITERADVGKGTFYRHFASKEEVKGAIILQATEELTSRLADLTGPYEDMPGALNAVLTVHLDFFSDKSQLFAVLFQDRLLLGCQQTRADEQEPPYTTYLQQIQRVIGEFLPAPPDWVKLRQLTHAIGGFAWGTYSFTMVGLDITDSKNELGPFRKGFIHAAVNFLQLGGPARSEPPELPTKGEEHPPNDV